MIRALTAAIFGLFVATGMSSAEVLPVVGDDNAKPKNWLNADAMPVGIQIELLEEISRRTGIEFTFELAPWKRSFVLSENGKAAIIGFSKTKERERLWDYSAPLYFDELVFVVRKNDTFDFTDLESIGGRMVGVKSGATYGDDFEQAKKDGHITIVETTDREDQLRMLVARRVDLVLLSPGRIALETIIAENEWLSDHRDDFEILSPAYKLDPNYIGIPKSLNKSHLLPDINEAIDQIRADGTYDEIVQRVTQTVVDSLQQN
jgi:polar amino acid transport system substrate-binding protein